MANSSNSFDLNEIFQGLRNLIVQRVGTQSSPAQKEPDQAQLDLSVLSALADRSKNIREIVQTIELTSAGALVASTGSVRESLSRLLDAGDVSVRTKADRKVYKITDSGESKLRASLTAAPSSSQSKSRSGATKIQLPFDPNFGLEAYKLVPVLMDIAQTGTKAQQVLATELLEQTRKRLHQILADE